MGRCHPPTAPTIYDDSSNYSNYSDWNCANLSSSLLLQYRTDGYR